MKDKDLEQRILVDPATDLDDVPSGEERREAEALRAEMQALDARIAKALEVDVPEWRLPELPDADGERVVDMPESNKPRLSAPTWIGIAASFLLVAAIGTRFLGPEPGHATLAEEIVAHLEYEPRALRVTDERVAERRLERVVNRSGAAINPDVGLISYARTCIINGREVPHLVMQGKSGPITLLLMPEESIDRAIPLDGDSIHGVILPVGDGSIAIIGDKDADLAAIEQQVVDSVSWTI